MTDPGATPIVGPALPNIPWEERPAACSDLVWRSARNPVIPRDLLSTSNSIFNSAVVPFGDGYAGVLRVDDRRRRMRIHSGRSADGLAWEIDPEPIRFATGDPELAPFEHQYDPRVCWLEDR
ncbi:MAG: glycosidase, partial [Anaerolineae bacterium]|nr:glycosidase [Anaerolineae bacterium]